jgi:hypothetical protein
VSAGLWKYTGGAKAPQYGTSMSYKIAADWLEDGCGTVEDWGCGAAAAKPFFKKAKYIGIDGSPGRADIVADLRRRRSKTEGILIRHVLEHNYDWARILKNAIWSFEKRLAIILFLAPARWTTLFCLTPMAPGVTVPNLHLSRTVMMEMIRPHPVEEIVLPRTDDSAHKNEWLFLVKHK